MAKRGDSSTFLYHWIKSNLSSSALLEEKYQDAFNTLLSILNVYALKSGRVLGVPFGHSCICFTESPASFMSNDNSKYQPFGLEFNKNDIYSLGGEHVIYCSEEEARKLPQEMRWKWMRHEPLSRTDKTPYGVDFTWEREVRLPLDELELIGPNDIVEASSLGNVNFTFTGIYVPTPMWRERLLHELRAVLNSRLRNEEGNSNHFWYEAFYDDMMSEYEYTIFSLT